VRFHPLAVASAATGVLALAGLLAIGKPALGEPPSAAVAAPPAAAARPLRIVAIGDSITQGGRAGSREYTYRWPLARMLEDEGFCVSFVGSHHGGLDPDARWPAPWDADHEGYYGATTEQVRAHLAATLPTFEAPDLALVHLGTNDRARLGGDTVEPLRAIVALLRGANPRVAVLIAEPALAGLRAAAVVPRLRWLARTLATDGSPVETVDLHSGWVGDPERPDADTFDGVHPNPRGQRRMAEAWLLAMRPRLPAPPPEGCPPA
jgi:acyl-CoA thioesterase-1